MALEHRALKARAAETGPSAGDYTRPDTLASLSMGVASLVIPLATAKLARPIAPGGRYRKVLLGTAALATAATTWADRARRRRREPVLTASGAAGSHSAPSAWPDRVATVGGVVAVATGGLALTTGWNSLFTPARMWRRGQSRDLGGGPVAWLAAMAGWDFIYYWNHRFMHEARGMWAIHVVHHSSERYNLSTALRQPVADLLGAWVPYGLLARVGVRPGLIAQARGWNLLYQFWIHTEAVDRIGVGEEILNTPSHHRVHHGSNLEYIDRNHGSILILWDRLFGTFQREDERVVYGLTKNIDTYNPGRIASHEYRDIVRDVARSTTWRDRLSFVLRGPGWAYRRHAERAELDQVSAGYD